MYVSKQPLPAMFVGLFFLGVTSAAAAAGIHALARRDGRDRTDALIAAGKTFGSVFVSGFLTGHFLRWW